MKPWIAWGKALMSRITKADTASYAAALAYNFLFALFPLLLFLTALLGLFHLPTLRDFFRGPGTLLLAPSVRGLILKALSQARSFRSPTLLSLGAVGFIWAMSGSLRQLTDALNHAYRYTHLSRPFWKTYVLSVVLGLLLGALMAASEAIVTVGGDLVRIVSMAWLHHRPDPFGVEVIRWGVLLVLMWIILTLIYNWLPDRVARFRWISPGTVVVMAAWIVISLGFSLYASHFNHYNKTYGSLGGVILLMLYLYILSFALLVGAEINAIGSKGGSPP